MVPADQDHPQDRILAQAPPQDPETPSLGKVKDLEILKLRIRVAALENRERIRNRRCALDVAGRVLNHDMGNPTRQPLISESVVTSFAKVITDVAGHLEEWLNRDLQDTTEGTQE